jgi:hypothetical protein
MSNSEEQPKKRGRPKGSKNKKSKAKNELSTFATDTEHTYGYKEINPGDNTRFLSGVLDISTLPKIDTNNPEEVKKRIKQYFQICACSDLKPGLAGLALSLGVSRQSLAYWAAGKYKKDKGTVDAIEDAKAVLGALWEQYMANGKVNPVTGIFIGKNDYGYRDQTEHIVVAENDNNKSIAELEAKYSANDFDE